MKTYIRFTLTAAILSGLFTVPARADDDVAVALGGFLAGIITGSIIDDHQDYRGEVHIRDYGSHDRYYRHDCNDRCRHGHDYGRPTGSRGYWEVRKVRIWIPGEWRFVYDRCGDRVRIWKPGYYSWRHERIWIPGRGKYNRHGYWD